MVREQNGQAKVSTLSPCAKAIIFSGKDIGNVDPNLL